MKINIIIATVLLALFSAVNAIGEVHSKVIESRITSVPSEDKVTRSFTYKIYGPDKVEYFVEGSKTEVDRLAELVQSDPSAVVRFQGEVVEGPRKTFRITRWEKTTTRTSDSAGSTTTETQTERTTIN